MLIGLAALVARDDGGIELASTDVVLPVSDEMDCRGRHASGSSGPAAQPGAGLAWDGKENSKLRQVSVTVTGITSIFSDGLESEDLLAWQGGE